MSSVHKAYEIEPSIHEVQDVNIIVTTKRRFQMSGWKVGVTTWAALAIVVCLLNIAALIWATVVHDSRGPIAPLYKGSCSTVSQMSLWMHLLINILSTLLLSGSNCKRILLHVLLPSNLCCRYDASVGLPYAHGGR